jgi:hypothetical protein
MVASGSAWTGSFGAALSLRQTHLRPVRPPNQACVCGPDAQTDALAVEVVKESSFSA